MRLEERDKRKGRRYGYHNHWTSTILNRLRKNGVQFDDFFQNLSRDSQGCLFLETTTVDKRRIEQIAKFLGKDYDFLVDENKSTVSDETFLICFYKRKEDEE